MSNAIHVATAHPPRPVNRHHEWCDCCRTWLIAELVSDGVCCRCFTLRMMKGAA